MQEQAQLFPAQAVSQYAQPAGQIESPDWLYPLLQLASQYATAGAGQQGRTYAYPGEQISGGVSCCWTFLEAEGKITQIVRRYRDEHFGKWGSVGIGYRVMSRYLVPLMKKHKWIKKLVQNLMTRPLTCYAKWYYGENKLGWVFKPLELLYVSAWKLLSYYPKFNYGGSICGNF
jgi:hypothetical protein